MEFSLNVSWDAVIGRAEEGDAYALNLVSDSKAVDRFAKAALKNLSDMLGKKVTAHYDGKARFAENWSYACSVPVKSWGEAKAVYDMVDEQMNSRREGEVCVGVRFVFAHLFFFYPSAGYYPVYPVQPDNQSRNRTSEPTLKEWLDANKP